MNTTWQNTAGECCAHTLSDARISVHDNVTEMKGAVSWDQV